MRRADLPRPGPAPSPRSARRGKPVELDERLDLLARAPVRVAGDLDGAADDGGDGSGALLDGPAAQAQLALDARAGLGDLALAATLELRQVTGQGALGLVDLLLGGADGAVALAQRLGELDDVVAGLQHGARVGQHEALGVRAGLGGGRLLVLLSGHAGLSSDVRRSRYERSSRL